MVLVTMDADCESLLRQVAADLDVSPSEAAQVLLESALVMSLDR
jgi:predicted MFS family arabinose efflux permease